VAEGTASVRGTSVSERAGGVNVGGADVGVVNTSTEKLQALSQVGLNRRIINTWNNLCCFIPFSLSAIIG
jgi:hypothetical protein